MSRHRWLGWQRGRGASLNEHSARQNTGGENHNRRKNDLPNLHQVSSTESALANTAVSNSCDKSASAGSEPLQNDNAPDNATTATQPMAARHNATLQAPSKSTRTLSARRAMMR